MKLKGKYTIHINGYDWGCCSDSVLICFDEVIDSVSKEDIQITETRETTDWSSLAFPIVVSDFNREIEAICLTDETGKPIHGPSRFMKIDLKVSPNDGSVLCFNMHTQYNTWADPYKLSFSLKQPLYSGSKKVEEIEVTDSGKRDSIIDEYPIHEYKASDGTLYQYLNYIPEKSSDTLVVWLHGLGEGGNITVEKTDVRITALANKVTALFGKEFQDTMKGAHVLVPQCPTYWMDKDGKQTNFHHGMIKADGTSYYMESLVECIDWYANSINAKKIILTGCSNGGYMTQVLGMNYPGKWAGLVPICEAVPDKYITDKQIQNLAETPIFYIYSKDDPIVDPKIHEIPTIERIRKENPVNLKVSTTDHVIDESGLYANPDGTKPYLYSGHWSWIYFDNNSSKDDKTQIPVWDWMASL